MVIEKTELVLYAEFIHDLADSNSDVIFRNAGPEHASIVFSNIFRTAKSEIRIYSKGLGHKVTNDQAYLDELEGFILRGGNLKIMLEEEIDEESTISSLIDKYSKSIVIRKKVGPVFNYLDSETGEKTSVHFTTADSRMYRVENDINGHKARGSFNGPSDALALEKLYDEVFLNN